MSSDDELAEIESINEGSIANGELGPFWFDAGIYPVEGFILLEIGMFEISKGYPGIQVTVFHLHIFHFHLDFGFVKGGMQ